MLGKVKNGLKSGSVGECATTIKTLDSYGAFLISFPPVIIRECLDVVDFHETNKEQRKNMAIQWNKNIRQMRTNKRVLESIKLDKA